MKHADDPSGQHLPPSGRPPETPGGATGRLLLGPLLQPYTDDELALREFDASLMRLAYALRTGLMFDRCNRLRGQSPGEFRLRLEVRRERFLAGDGIELLRAVVECADEGLPLPDWIAEALSERLQRFVSEAGPHSLDLLFPSEAVPTSGARALKARRDWRLAVPVWRDVCDAVFNRKASLDAALVAALKRRPRLGLAKHRARKLVVEIDEAQRAFTRRRQSLLEKSLQNRKALRGR